MIKISTCAVTKVTDVIAPEETFPFSPAPQEAISSSVSCTTVKLFLRMDSSEVLGIETAVFFMYNKAYLLKEYINLLINILPLSK